MLRLRSWVEHRGEGLTTVAEFTVKEGQKVPFTLAWHPSTEPPPPGLDAEAAIRDAEALVARLVGPLPRTSTATARPWSAR